MALPAPHHRLSLTDPVQRETIPLETAQYKSRELSVHGGHEATAVADESLSQHSSSRSVDIETRWESWICVFSSFLFLAPSYGFMQSVGTVQAHLTLNQLANYSNRDVGWITGIYTFVALFLGIQTGPLVDVYGPRKLAPLAAAVCLPMFFLLAECTEYWHFMLCLGALGGIGGAITSTIAVVVVGKIFVRLQGLAMGLALAGSSTGGVIFPLLLREVIPRWGFKWAMRTLGFVMLVILVGACLCLWPYDELMRVETPVADPETAVPIPDEAAAGDAETQTAPTPALAPKRSAGINFTAFRSPAFSLVTGCFVLLEFVIFGITGMLPTVVSWANFPYEAGYNLIAIINGASFTGRVLAGFFSDRIGHYNVLIVMIAASTLFTAVTFVPFGATHVSALYAFAALWGFGSGTFLSLTSVCIGKTCEAKDYGRYYGTMNFPISFVLLVTLPVSGQMLESMGAQALSGLYLAILCLGGGSAFPSRSLLLGSWFDLRRII